jgi:hypothetical protein
LKGIFFGHAMSAGFIGKKKQHASLMRLPAGGCRGMLLAGWNFLSQRKAIYGSGGCCYTLKVRIQPLAGPIPQKIWYSSKDLVDCRILPSIFCQFLGYGWDSTYLKQMIG